MITAEIREMSLEQLKQKEQELREDSLRLRFKNATGELEDTSKLKKTRKDIARIKTLISQREREEANGN